MKKHLILIALVIIGLSSCAEAPSKSVVSVEEPIKDCTDGTDEPIGYESLITNQPHFVLMIDHIPSDVLLALCMSQLFAESSFREDAISPANAKGIAQFRDSTWRQWGDGGDPFNPQDAISAQLKYMHFLYSKFEEIPNPLERYKFALASYNLGRSRVNSALVIARQKCGHPRGLSTWKSVGSPKGEWQNWWYTSKVLWEMYPYAKETVEYVDRVFSYALVYNAEGR